ncbi:hypothetical protein VC87395_003525 [Vibrio paracholerae 87395]|nr:hypothetical protein VC87395_003525 [Vibrio paracholerae 87395]
MSKLTAFKVELATYRISDKKSAISATMQPFVKPSWQC